MNNKQYIQMMCAGEFYEKSAREAIQLFDTIAENARTWETNTSVDTAKVHNTPIGGGIHHLKENDELQEKIANLTRKLEAIEMKKVNEVTSVPQVSHPDSRSDPIGGSEPSSGCETQDWDSLPEIFFFF